MTDPTFLILTALAARARACHAASAGVHPTGRSGIWTRPLGRHGAADEVSHWGLFDQTTSTAGARTG